MQGFAQRDPRKRYLWTDAFALCNYLALARTTGDGRYLDHARRLIDAVHHVLGRHRPDDVRRGWLSGLSAEQGELQPTLGGLRIGKPLPERGPRQPLDEQLEWERDGQYFHYLTKWMHALDQAARWMAEPRFNRWARQLAETAHRSFVRDSRMFWKMSIDLSRPLVASMGQHDPLDGYVTCLELRATAAHFGMAAEEPTLGQALSDFERLMVGVELETADPLGLGGLLMDARRIEQLMRHGAAAAPELFHALLAAARLGLARYVRQGDLRRPANVRLAFRELGLAIGLSGIEAMSSEGSEFSPYLPLRRAIQSFWLEPENQLVRTFTEHRDINEVMLATSLAPEGCLAWQPAD
jgi:hypothetical protein